MGRSMQRSAGEPVEIRSYLDSEEHIRAAKESGADAIHPGYGFLAESAEFAEAVDAAGLVFVGPSAEALRLGGDKLEAKRIAAESGVPVVPTGEPDEVGYPLIVKAAAGGGGRGMRVVREPSELERRSKPQSGGQGIFGDDRASASATSSGRATSRSSSSGRQARTVLGERGADQRRHQGARGAPSTALDPGCAARQMTPNQAEAIGYASGTAEFMLASDFSSRAERADPGRASGTEP